MRFLFLLLFLCAVSTAAAKRAGPPAAITVRFLGIEATTSTRQCGVLLIRDSRNPAKTLEKRVYRVWHNPFMERDVQDVWIKEMFLSGTNLIMRDERHRVWSMGMKRFDVTHRKDLEGPGFDVLLKKSR